MRRMLFVLAVEVMLVVEMTLIWDVVIEYIKLLVLGCGVVLGLGAGKSEKGEG